MYPFDAVGNQKFPHSANILTKMGKKDKKNTTRLCFKVGWHKTEDAKVGRPRATADDGPAVFLHHDPAFQNKQLNVSELATVCALSRTTAYKYI